MISIVRINRYFPYFRWFVFCVNCLPAFYLLAEFYFQQLGINPFARLSHFTGHTAVLYLILTLLITPIRRWLTWLCRLFQCQTGKRLSDWNFLIKIRRQLGLFSFFYALIHFWIYLYLEQDLQWLWVWEDSQERPAVFIGFILLSIYLVLALTSPDWCRKKLGKSWRKIHRSVYVLALLVVAHLFYQEKSGNFWSFIYLGVFAVLLGHRVLVSANSSLRQANDDGMEAVRPEHKP